MRHVTNKTVVRSSMIIVRHKTLFLRVETRAGNFQQIRAYIVKDLPTLLPNMLWKMTPKMSRRSAVQWVSSWALSGSINLDTLLLMLVTLWGQHYWHCCWGAMTWWWWGIDESFREFCSVWKFCCQPGRFGGQYWFNGDWGWAYCMLQEPSAC